MGSERRRLRLLVADATGQRILVGADGALPAVDLSFDPPATTLLAASEQLPALVGLGPPFLESFIDNSTPSADDTVAVLVEVRPVGDGWVPPASWTWRPVTGAAPVVEPGLRDPLDNLLRERAGDRSVPPTRTAWSAPDWFDRATEWIERTLAAAGWPPPDAVVQHRHWGISATMRVDAGGRRCWFKAVFPVFAHEPAITELLAQEAPGWVPDVLGADHDRGWLLVAHAGDATVAEHPDRTDDAVDHLVSLQRRLGARAPELVAGGCRHRPLRGVADDLAHVLSSPTIRPWLDVDADEAARLGAWLQRAATAVERLGIADTLAHGDFHPGNVTVDGDRVVLIDWSDASVTNPLVDVVTWASWYPDEPDRLDRLWAAFATAWADVVEPDRLLAMRPTIEGVAGAFHAVSYALILEGLESTRRAENAHGLTDFFALLHQAVDG